MRANIPIELTRLAITFVENEKGYSIICPFHSDAQPSCQIYKDNCAFKCFGCQKGGDLITLISALSHKPRHLVETELNARYGKDDPPIEAAQIERYHAAIWGELGLRGELVKRCIDDETIREYRLGVDGDRITIPIQNLMGEYVNIRRYLPGAKDAPKFTNSRGRGKKLRLYPYSQLRFSEIIICGGEIKALAAANILNEHGIGAIAPTGGELDWSVGFDDMFVNKRVWICSDIDATGEKSAEFRCNRLAGVAKWVGNLVLPLDITKYPHGDLNDYIRDCGAIKLQSLLDECQEFVPKALTELSKREQKINAPAIEISLADTLNSNYVGLRVSCGAIINAVNTTPYYLPRTIQVNCGQDQDYCALCPVFSSAKTEFTIHSESSNLLAMIDANKKALHEEIKEALLIPSVCRVCEFETLTTQTAVEARAQKPLSLSDNTSDRQELSVVIVNAPTELNTTYNISGSLLPNPKTQSGVMLASELTPVADALASFEVGDTDDLRIFRPKKWTVNSITERLDSIYDYYSRNITRIYSRKPMHQLIDLAYHSVLNMVVNKQNVKGWLEVLILGDSSQGKSEAATNLQNYYGLGAKVDCKNATVAGLLGGLDQINGKWFAQWGVIPTYDRQLVILEELKGLRAEVFTKLTDMRSSGVAEIPKIQRSKAMARTRLIALSNPASGHSMDYYSNGVKAIVELVKNPEDVRRFDMAMILNGNDIDAEIFDSRFDEIAEPFDIETARRLVLWAWTRKADQVIIDHETIDIARYHAKDLCSQFSEAILLVDRGGVRFKLLRLACALACRTFSADVSGYNVEVLPCHVEWVADFLREEYESSASGYADFSIKEKLNAKLRDSKAIIDIMVGTGNGEVLAEKLLNAELVNIQDVQDACGSQRDSAGLVISVLVRNNAMMREENNYRKTPSFVKLLKEANFKMQDKPKHIQ